MTLLKHYYIQALIYFDTSDCSILTLWYTEIFWKFLDTSLFQHFWHCCIDTSELLQYSDNSEKLLHSDTSDNAIFWHFLHTAVLGYFSDTAVFYPSDSLLWDLWHTAMWKNSILKHTISTIKLQLLSDIQLCLGLKPRYLSTSGWYIKEINNMKLYRYILFVHNSSFTDKTFGNQLLKACFKMTEVNRFLSYPMLSDLVFVHKPPTSVNVGSNPTHDVLILW